MDMVDDQIISRGVRDKRVIQAMRDVPREIFVPKKERAFSYGDHPLPIGYGQTISQPYIVAYMTEELNIKNNDRVLEIGTGSGYQTAILAMLAYKVYSVERVKELTHYAENNLKSINIDNIEIKSDDGYYGWKSQAPFNKIIVTAAAPLIPSPLVEQLSNDGGKMIIPIGEEFSVQYLTLIIKKDEDLTLKRLIPVRFVPFISKNITP